MAMGKYKFYIVFAAIMFMVYLFAVPTLTNWLGGVAGGYAAGVAVTVAAVLTFWVTKKVEHQV